VVGTRRDALTQPDLFVAEVLRQWVARVAAGTPIDVTFTWHDGPFVPGRSGGTAHAVVRFRARAATLELAAPPRSVAFPS
jgi:hypothetical protein